MRWSIGTVEMVFQRGILWKMAPRIAHDMVPHDSPSLRIRLRQAWNHSIEFPFRNKKRKDIRAMTLTQSKSHTLPVLIIAKTRTIAKTQTQLVNKVAKCEEWIIGVLVQSSEVFLARCREEMEVPSVGVHPVGYRCVVGHDVVGVWKRD